MSDKKRKNRFIGTLDEVHFTPSSSPNFYHRRLPEIQEVLSRYEPIEPMPQMQEGILDKPASEWIQASNILYRMNRTALNLDTLRLNKLILIECSLEEISLRNTVIEEFVVIRGNLQRANFTDASLDKSIMVGVEASEAIFVNAHVCFAWLEGDFSKSNFNHAQLEKTIIKGNFADVSFKGANLEDSWQREVNLYTTDFTDARMKGSVGDLTAMNLKIILPDGSIYIPITNDFHRFTKKAKE
jgi:uncharacterized protein YjbI with pentapeptide repeats